MNAACILLVYLSLPVISTSLAQPCCKFCNLWVGVVLNVRFSMNGMCVKNNTHIYWPEVCKDWIWDYLDPESVCFQQDQEWGFLSCSQIQFGFCFCWKSVAGFCLTHVFPDSHCLNLVSTGSGLDSDSKNVKTQSGLSNFAIQIQSWIFKTQSKSNHSPKRLKI